MLTEEEKEEIRETRKMAKANCHKAYKLVLEHKEILNEFKSVYHHWKGVYEDADMKLALEEKLTKVTPKKKEIVLTIDQIREIAKRLGVKLPELE